MQPILHCFKMVAIGSYFSFVIIMMGTLLVAQDFSDEEKNQFFQDILKEHNSYRKKHGSRPLVLKKKMCETAKELAEAWIEGPGTMALPVKYETNYFAMKFESDPVLDPKMIVNTWYQYAKQYDYFIGKSSNRFTDLFTRIVWKNTKYIGVGISLQSKMLAVVVTYSPPGNQPGQYKSNVIDPRNVALLEKQLTDPTNELEIQ